MNNENIISFPVHIKKVEFKKSYGDNLISIILEPCYIQDQLTRAKLSEFQQMEEGLFEASIKPIKNK